MLMLPARLANVSMNNRAVYLVLEDKKKGQLALGLTGV